MRVKRYNADIIRYNVQWGTVRFIAPHCTLLSGGSTTVRSSLCRLAKFHGLVYTSYQGTYGAEKRIFLHDDMCPAAISKIWISLFWPITAPYLPGILDFKQVFRFLP